MKEKQIDIFGNQIVRCASPDEKAKRNFENGFQRWSNEQAQNEIDSLGICGFGSMCDYCEDNTYGRPCVRALNAMLRDKRITIDYKTKSFQEVWEGDL